MSAVRPHGSGHWIAQRISAFALIPLGLWFMGTLATRSGLSRTAWLEYLAAPWHATLAGLLLLTLLLHSYLGIQVVIEDYVHTRGRERALRLLNTMLHFTAAATGLFAILQIARGLAA